MKLKKPDKHDKIRLIFFSTKESEIRQFEFNLRRLVFVTMITTAVMGMIFVGSVTICNNLYQDNTNENLRKTNAFLKDQVVNLHDHIEKLNEKVVLLEEDTEDLEVLVGLSSTDSTIQSNAAPPLLTDEVFMAAMPLDYEYKTDKMAEYLNALESRIKHALNIQTIIEDKFIQNKKEIKRFPSIRPVEGGRVTDGFGNRRDPFIERVKHHNGLDLSARYGTKVFAAASGVVEFTRTRYRLNTGYGKVVIINHDNGYKTLYGHLANITVKPGQKVERWDVLGLSGDTGRATGPHLHYEVWYNGKPENPENYILN